MAVVRTGGLGASRPVIVLLSGSSSSGKTSLSVELQSWLADPYLRIEADKAFPDGPPASRELAADRVVVAFHYSLASWAERGFNLIVDGSLPYGDHAVRAECLRQFDGHDLRLVGVSADVSTLRTREASRPDRHVPGWAVRQARDVNNGLEFAATVDTSTRSPADAAERVLDQLGLPRVASDHLAEARRRAGPG